MYKYILLLVLAAQSLFGQNLCKIQNIRFEQTACNDEGQFYVFINFDHQNTTNTFVVLGNSKNYGNFQYNQLPIKIGPLKADCTTQYEFLIKDNVYADCQSYKLMGKKCCTSQCNIYIDSVTAECHTTTLDLAISVCRPAKNTGKYKIKVNNENKGTFDLGSPAVIEDVDQDPLEPVMEIVACLVDTESCCDTFYYVNPCFCSITGFKTQVVECSEEAGLFTVRLDFTGTMTGDSFIIGGNNTTYGKYAYSQLPIIIHNLPFSPTTFYEFLVIDQSSSFCFGAYELGIVESCRFDCRIEKPKIDILPCDEEGKFIARLRFKEENTSFSGFRVRGNGNIYGEFDYGAHYYDVGPLSGDCETLYEFVVRDIELESCQNHVSLEEPICCKKECFIRDVIIEEVCEDGKLKSFYINFDHSQIDSAYFFLWANGKKLGTFLFSDLPLQINTFGFDFPEVEFKIISADDESCRATYTYNFVCSPPDNNPCVLKITEFIISECVEDRYVIYFTIQNTNTGNKGFRIVSDNGNFSKEYAYGSALYSMGPFKGDCMTKYNFTIQDIQFPDCKKSYTQEKAVCCNENNDCFIREVNITEICEGDKLAGYKINFDHNQDSTKKFVLFANGFKVGEFPFGSLPLTISQITFNTRIVVFKIIALDNENCRKEITKEFTCYVDPNEGCEIKTAGLEIGDCLENGEFFIYFKLNVRNTGSQGFTVYNMDNVAIQTFPYGQNTYKIGPFEGNCITKYRFLIKDKTNPSCAAEFGLSEAVCCNKDCSFDSINIEKAECINGLFAVTINFMHAQSTGSFNLKVNGVARGTYQYQDLPITIRQLAPKTTYKLIFQDVEKDCIEDFTLTTPECTTSTLETEWNPVTVARIAEGFLISRRFDVQRRVTIQLTDILGRPLNTTILDKEPALISMTNAPSGMYFITLRENDKSITLKVFWNQ